MLGFLHTAAAHVATFEQLLRAADPLVPSRHVVETELLDDARAAGGVTPEIARRVGRAVDDLRASGAQVVLCTCSTIGDAAEAASGDGTTVLRVDRPMAERAVALGVRIAFVAALESTLKPTAALLQDAAERSGRRIELTPVLCTEAWPHFESGKLDAYYGAIADAAERVAGSHDVVVLAQGSMGPAAERIATAVPVLSSPRLGIEAALRALRNS
ncbi:MAG: hypothetical protein ABI629_14170 [bacterium]